MVVQRMGSQGGGGNSNGGTQTQTQTHDPKSNQLAKQGSLYSLTLDEVQTQLGDLGKPFNSMNLDELLKTVFTAEERVDPASGPSLDREAGVTFSKDLSKKTVDEVWNDIQQGQKKSSLDRNVTFGEMTLEDFLVKAGVVAESAKNPDSVTNTGSVTVGADPIGLYQQAQWMNYQIPPQPVYMPPGQLGGNPGMESAYHDTQVMSSSDNQTPRRKRVAPDGVAEKSVERRQKRMIKNRESAARSRARKQAYTHELENKVSRLEEENERLKRQQEWEKVLPTIPPPQEPKCQLRRTSSSPI